MAVEIKVPSVGESVAEGRLAKWLVTNGALAKADQPLYELETDKASQQIESETTGVLKILVQEGEIVAIGQVIAQIDPAGSPKAGDNKPAVAAPAASASKATAPKASAGAENTASPAARSLMLEKNLDPSEVSPTGPGGRITKEDVLAALAKPAATPTPATKPSSPPTPTSSALAPSNGEVRETRQPMTMIRKRIAERLLESQNTTATLTTFNEVDMSGVMDLRAKYNDKFEKKYGIKLGFMSVFAKAAVEALKAFPMVNARIDGSDIVMQNFYDIGVAVSTEKGLMVPVIRHVDQLSFAGIEKAIGEVAKKARDNKITMNDLQGGTFTITNGGIFGSMLSTPILNPPQTAILGMHTIQKRAMVVNDEIVIRPMMYLALSYDHRLIDGREAVQFLVRIKECIENPERMLFGI